MTKPLTVLALSLTLALTQACENRSPFTPSAHAHAGAETPRVVDIGPSRQSFNAEAGLTTDSSWLHPWPDDPYVSVDRNMCNGRVRTGHLYRDGRHVITVNQDGSDLGVC